MACTSSHRPWRFHPMNVKSDARRNDGGGSTGGSRRPGGHIRRGGRHGHHEQCRNHDNSVHDDPVGDTDDDHDSKHDSKHVVLDAEDPAAQHGSTGKHALPETWALARAAARTRRPPRTREQPTTARLPGPASSNPERLTPTAVQAAGRPPLTRAPAGRVASRCRASPSPMMARRCPALNPLRVPAGVPRRSASGWWRR